MDATVDSGKMTLRYPQGAADAQFRFLVSTFADATTVTGWEDLPGLSVEVSGDVDTAYSVERAAQPSMGFDYWNFVYNVTGATPSIELKFSLQ